MRRTPYERFMAQVVVDEDGCWLWRGRRDWPRYPRLDKTSAGRAMWRRHRGEIPDGLVVCHTCDQRACVNPAHLFLGDYQANTRDAVRKGRWHKKLTPAQTREIRDAVLSGEHAIDVACRYRISEGHVRKIARGECWQVNA